MLPGYNHNIRHRGRVFHVQTEDGGLSNPYVVTTLFFAGNVLAMRRRSYQKFLQVKDLPDIVLAMMQEQHRDLMKDLVNSRLRSVADLFDQMTPAEATDPTFKPVPPSKDASPSSGSAPKEKPVQATLDSDSAGDKSLDELILDFLKGEGTKKP